MQRMQINCPSIQRLHFCKRDVEKRWKWAQQTSVCEGNQNWRRQQICRQTMSYLTLNFYLTGSNQKIAENLWQRTMNELYRNCKIFYLWSKKGTQFVFGLCWLLCLALFGWLDLGISKKIWHGKWTVKKDIENSNFVTLGFLSVVYVCLYVLILGLRLFLCSANTFFFIPLERNSRLGISCFYVTTWQREKLCEKLMTDRRWATDNYKMYLSLRHRGKDSWLVLLRIYVASVIFQTYCDLKQERTNLWNRSVETGNRTLDLLLRKPRS